MPYVQSAATGVPNGNASTTIAATFSSPVGSGGLVVGSASSDTSVSVDHVTDDQSNNYSVVRTTAGAFGIQVSSFYAKNITNGPTTITVTFTGSAIYRGLVIEEASGIDTASPLDQETGQYQLLPGVGTDAITSGAVTTTVDGEFIYSVCTRGAGVGPDSVAAGTGFTRRQTTADPGNGNVENYCEDLVQTSAGSIAGTWTTVSDGAFMTQILTFKPSGGGGAARHGLPYQGAG